MVVILITDDGECDTEIDAFFSYESRSVRTYAVISLHNFLSLVAFRSFSPTAKAPVRPAFRQPFPTRQVSVSLISTAFNMSDEV